jgi:hypothetical protein
VTVLPIRDTRPFRASARPCTVAPSAIVMDVRAMIVPMKVEPDPRVAELTTCQKTLHELAPRMSFTELADAVMRDEVVWKTQTELGSFWPSSVRVPVRSRMAPVAL